MKKIIIFLYLTIVASLFADGFIIVNPPTSAISNFPLEVKYHNVKVSIDDLQSVTEIDQVFHNPTNSILEGTYLFPVPKSAVIKEFSMDISGKETRAELLDANKAREIYEDIVRKMKDPALLEYSGTDLYKIRIYPIEPRSDKRVRIKYSEILEKDMNTIEYIYPLNTEKFSAKPLNNVTIVVDINSSIDVTNVYSTTHEIDIVNKNSNKIKVSFEANNTKPNIDFKLYINQKKSKVGISLLPYKERGEDGYFLMNLSASIETDDTIAKDATFVLDNSGSMSGKNMDQAKKALKFCVDNLNANDRFEIIRFSTEAEPLFGKLENNSSDNRDSARKFIDKIEAVGGTNIDEALSLALKNGGANRPHLIIFITDGKPTIGETDEKKLLDKIKSGNKNGVRIFTFGIGYDINTHLLDKITEQTNSYRSYITPDEDIEDKISKFYMKVKSPVFTDISLKFVGNSRINQIYPSKIPDIFKGSSVNIVGRYSGDGKVKALLEGKINGKTESFSEEFVFPSDSVKYDSIPSLWAARRVGYLLDQIRLLGKEEKELVDEIVDLARKYGIITPYTSYLIVEDETTRVSRNELDAKYQTYDNASASSYAQHNENKRRYDVIKEKSGKDSVEASRGFQTLNDSENIDKIQKIEDKNFTISNQFQIKNIMGRSFYQSGNFWNDSLIQEISESAKTIKIKFASDDYFSLMKKNPEVSKYLSLGKNIRFMFEKLLYEIYE